jgi:hypothetical protein
MIVATAFLRKTDLEYCAVRKRTNIYNGLAAICVSDSAVRKGNHDKRKRNNGKHGKSGTARAPAPACPRQIEHPAYESFSIHAHSLPPEGAKHHATNRTF